MTAYGVPEFIVVGSSKVCVDRGDELPNGWLDFRNFPDIKHQPQTVADAIQVYNEAALELKKLLEGSPILVIVCPNLWSQLTPMLNVR